MKSEKLFYMGPVVIELQDSVTDSEWSLWQWKLDPYLKTKEEKKASIVYGKADISIEAEELLYERVSGFYKQQIFKTQDGGIVVQEVRNRTGEIAISYHVTSDWKKIMLLRDTTSSSGLAAFEYLTHVVFYAAILMDVLTFHGVLMEHEGRGIIISADSGVGKTTHARMWRDQKGALIVNGDRASCYRRNGVWTGFGMPWCGTSGEYMKREVAIRAFVILEQGQQNVVRKLATRESFAYMFAQVLYPQWNQALLEKVLELLDDFLGEIPIWQLTCRPDCQAVEVLYDALREC